MTWSVRDLAASKEPFVNVIGIDAGGANIKACDADGIAHSVCFPLWKNADGLTDALRALMAEYARPDLVSLTMTGELADCFETKAEGVAAIVEATVAAAGSVPVRVWMTSGEFAEPDDAMDLVPLVAAANWHALATWAAMGVPQGPALLFDIGSTTTDIIPLLDGNPVSAGRTDPERLVSQELVYTGVGRTPICALLSSVTVHGRTYGVAAEWFATMADAYVIAGQLPEQPDCTDTADGRPLTKPYCAGRLAHLICCDRTELSDSAIRQIAAAAIERQRERILEAVRSVEARLQELLAEQLRTLEKERPTLIVSGSGGLLLSEAVAATLQYQPASVLQVASISGPAVAASACAFAVARLAQDRCADDLLEVSPF